jgi:hypothetical protein
VNLDAVASSGQVTDADSSCNPLVARATHKRTPQSHTRPVRYRFLISLLVMSIFALAIVAMQRRWIVLPPHLDPWSTLDIAAAPDWLTRFRLTRLTQDAGQCRAVLATTGIEYTTLDDRTTGEDCGFTNAVQIQRTPTAVGAPFALSCRTAVALAMWERHVVQPAAQMHLGQPVARFEHFGSYSCRNVYGRPAATRSRHATAEAWDVAGFVLADGRRVRIAAQWNGEGAESSFLRAARDGACRFFDGVLSPDYNAAHHDHLHLDRGPYRLCR